MSTLKKMVVLLSGDDGSAASLISWGWQFALTLGVLVWGGHWLDQHYGTRVLFVLIGIMMGLFGGFYRLYRIISSLPQTNKKKDSQP